MKSRILSYLGRRRFGHAYVCAAKASSTALFAVFKIHLLWRAGPVLSGDRRIWATIAANPWFSHDFLFPGRPIVYPALFKVAALSDTGVLRIQTSLSILGWCALAWSFAGLFGNGLLSLALFVSVLAIALTTVVHGWDVVIRSESSAMSFMVLAIAAALALIQVVRLNRRAAVVLACCAVISAALAAFSRDTTGYVLLPLVGFEWFALWQLTRRQLVTRLRRKFSQIVGAVSLATILVCVAAQYDLRVSRRYDFPLMNVIFQRILPHGERVRYFEQKLGMPVSRALMSRHHKWASSDHRYAFNAPELEEFRQWLYQRGYDGYQRYLLAHLSQTWTEAYERLPSALAVDGRREGRSVRFEFSGALDDWFVGGPLRDYPAVILLTATSLGAAGLFLRQLRVRIAAVVTLFFVGSALSQLYICYHGDAMEVGRHSIVVGVLLRLGVLSAAGLALASLASAWRTLKAFVLLRQRQRLASRSV